MKESALEVLVVGRCNSAQPPDLEVPLEHDTVGRRHAELTIGADGDCYVVDLGSTNGTFVGHGKRWKRIAQTKIAMDEPLRLGEYETTVRRLLALRRPSPPPQPAEPPRTAKPPADSGRKGKPRRNVLTGEIE